VVPNSIMLSAEDYNAELAERYGWINRALPADALGGFVSSLAHRVAGFPAAGHVAVKTRVNAIALAPAEEVLSRSSAAFCSAGIGPCVSFA
jgi:enoyl-CoA hydratase/carnithine racemase